MNSILKKNNVPDIRPGDLVRVFSKVKEGNKEREQAFEGVVIQRRNGDGPAASFMVRKISQGIGVERKFMLHSPFLVKVQVKKRSKVKRAFLTYLRNVNQMARKLKDKKIDPIETILAPKEKIEATEKDIEEAIQEDDKKKKEANEKNEEKIEENKKETTEKTENEKTNEANQAKEETEKPEKDIEKK